MYRDYRLDILLPRQHGLFEQNTPIKTNQDISLDAVCEQMDRVPPWLPGAVLRADGYETE